MKTITGCERILFCTEFIVFGFEIGSGNRCKNTNVCHLNRLEYSFERLKDQRTRPKKSRYCMKNEQNHAPTSVSGKSPTVQWHQAVTLASCFQLHNFKWCEICLQPDRKKMPFLGYNFSDSCYKPYPIITKTAHNSASHEEISVLCSCVLLFDLTCFREEINANPTLHKAYLNIQ